MTDSSPVSISPSSTHKGQWELLAELWLPQKRDQVFDFFADAGNLERITPPFLKFRIVTPQPIDMRQGALIDYKLKVHAIPVSWRTEITRWDPPFAFVDSQIRGPYSVWVHEHTFTDKDGGTMVIDKVRYRPPFGALANTIMVKRDLIKIFSYRHEVLKEIFGVTQKAA